MSGGISTTAGASRAVEPPFRSLLYREPRLYDLAFPDANGGIERMCREAFRRYLPSAPASALDLGCGTGRDLARLASTVGDCWGVDLLESLVDYARATHPGLRAVQGDMRSVRLGRRFDLVTSFGNALSYALTDGDLALTAATYAAHSHAGTLVAVDALNARSYLEGDGFRERIEGGVQTPEWSATSVATHVLHRGDRILERRRVWRISGRPDVEDYARYRLLYPEELADLLASAGFASVEIFDNREFRSSDMKGRVARTSDPGGMGGRKLYAFARRSAGAS